MSSRTTYTVGAVDGFTETSFRRAQAAALEIARDFGQIVEVWAETEGVTDEVCIGAAVPTETKLAHASRWLSQREYDETQPRG